MSTISAGVTVPTALNLSGDTTGALTFQVSGTVTAATITAAGNLGIGTTTPTDKFQIEGTGTSPVASIRSTTTGSINQAALNLFRGDSTNGFAQYGVGTTSTNTWQFGLRSGSTSWQLFDVSANTARMVVDTSGNVSVGTTTAFSRLTVSNGSGTRTGITISDTTSASLMLFAGASADAVIGIDTQNLVFKTGTTAGQDNGTERMRITSGGNVLIGTTSDLGSGARVNINSADAEADVLSMRYTSSAAGKHWRFAIDSNSTFYLWNQGGTGVYITDGATSWTGTSDERLKTDLKPIEDSVNKVCQLRAVTGRFKKDEEGVSRSFLIAQDVQKVFPEAVSDINPDELGLRYTDMIPLLVAAVKELKAENDALKARIEALESK